jgi:hypothetical protein
LKQARILAATARFDQAYPIQKGMSATQKPHWGQNGRPIDPKFNGRGTIDKRPFRQEDISMIAFTICQDLVNSSIPIQGPAD